MEMIRSNYIYHLCVGVKFKTKYSGFLPIKYLPYISCKWYTKCEDLELKQFKIFEEASIGGTTCYCLN